MKTRTLILFFLMLIASMSVISSCSNDDDNDDDNNPPNNAITMGADFFTPETRTVTAGTTITWTNTDDIVHTVTSNDELFDSGSMDPGENFTYTFSTPGTYTYTCVFHPGMDGTIIVN